MKKEDKSIVIDNLVEELGKYNHFYITDISGLNAERTFVLRKKCFEAGIKLSVVKTPCSSALWTKRREISARCTMS